MVAERPDKNTLLIIAAERRGMRLNPSAIRALSGLPGRTTIDRMLRYSHRDLLTLEEITVSKRVIREIQKILQELGFNESDGPFLRISITPKRLQPYVVVLSEEVVKCHSENSAVEWLKDHPEHRMGAKVLPLYGPNEWEERGK
jgi:hypothetical protein